MFLGDAGRRLPARPGDAWPVVAEGLSLVARRLGLGLYRPCLAVGRPGPPRTLFARAVGPADGRLVPGAADVAATLGRAVTPVAPGVGDRTVALVAHGVQARHEVGRQDPARPAPVVGHVAVAVRPRRPGLGRAAVPADDADVVVLDF